ncbi:MAG: hypothetical protein LBB63_03995 [Holosporaceae bacterium]|nr:hypothetical protein [Holosporaceae bacterium]
MFFLSMTVALTFFAVLALLMGILFFLNITPLWPFYCMTVATLVMGFRAAAKSPRSDGGRK